MDKTQIAYLAGIAERPIDYLHAAIRAMACDDADDTRRAAIDAYNALLELRDALDKELGGRTHRIAIDDEAHWEAKQIPTTE